MQIILRGVMGRIVYNPDGSPSLAHIPGVTFLGPDLPRQPFWATFNNTVPGASEYARDGADLTEPGWTVVTDRGANIIPQPISSPPPVAGDYPYFRWGAMYGGYRNIDTLYLYCNPGEEVVHDPATGLFDVFYTVRDDDGDYKYADLIRKAQFVLLTRSSTPDQGYSAGYVRTAAGLDIIDGPSTVTVDFSKSLYLSHESAVWNNSWDGTNEGIETIGMYYTQIEQAPPDIFWTKRALCEETLTGG